MKQLLEDIKKMGFLNKEEEEFRILSIYDDYEEEKDSKNVISLEDEFSTGIFDEIDLVGKRMDGSSKIFFEKSRDFAAKLILNFIQGRLGEVHSLPQYRSRSIKEGQELFEIDIDSTLEHHLDDPTMTVPWVFERRKSRNPVVLLVDTSYSMNGEKLLMAALAVATLAKLVDPKDLAIVSFNDEVLVVKGFRDDVSGLSLLHKVLSLRPRGYTDLSKALDFGGRLVSPFVPYCRLIVMTDADPTRGKNPLTVAASLHQLDVLLFPMGNKWLGKRLSEEAHYGKTIELHRPEEVPEALKKIFDPKRA